MLKTFTKGEKKLLKGLKMEYFQFIMMSVRSLEKKMKKMKKNKTLIKQITDEETDTNDEIFEKYVKVQRSSDMLVFLNRANDTEMKNQLVNLINSGLKDFCFSSITSRKQF